MVALFYYEVSMSYYVYILQNDTTGKTYTGQTSNLEERIKRHNSDYGKGRYTRKHDGSWYLIYSEKYETRSKAMKRESFFKSGKGRKWIQNNIIKKG